MYMGDHVQGLLVCNAVWLDAWFPVFSGLQHFLIQWLSGPRRFPHHWATQHNPLKRQSPFTTQHNATPQKSWELSNSAWGIWNHTDNVDL